MSKNESGNPPLNKFSLKEIGFFLSMSLWGIPKTAVIGNLRHEKGRHWPKSGSYLLPVLESVGKSKTPLELYPIVNLFYDYVRTTDNLFDKRKDLPRWEETKKNLETIEKPLFERLEKSKTINEVDKEYIIERINFLGKSVYKTMEDKSKWTKAPSFEEAYSYRWDTTGLLSDVVADIWCKFVGTPDDLREKTREAIKRLGMAFQSRDDLFDLRQDGEKDGNLVLAIFNEESEKDSLFSSIEKSKSKINLVKLMKVYSPKSFKRTMDYLDRELKILEEQSPDAGSKLANLVKFATKNNIFIRTE